MPHDRMANASVFFILRIAQVTTPSQVATIRHTHAHAHKLSTVTDEYPLRELSARPTIIATNLLILLLAAVFGIPPIKY